MHENFILVPCSTNVKPFVGSNCPWRTLVPAITLDDVVKPYLHLPTAIQTALMRVETHPVFRSITKSALLVLKTLVARASARNGMSIIRARIDRMSAEAGVSEKTTQRALARFRELGWVMPASEGRSEWGVFESKRYIFSDELCELVNLPTKAKPAPEPAPQTEMSDGAIYVDLSYKKDLGEISIKNRKGQPPTLPPAVQQIPEETGMLATGVCKLLGIARQAGYQLEHVYEAAKPYLVKIGASPARTFRYLQAMLLNPKKVDYAGKAAQELRQSAPDSPTSLAAIARLVRFKKYVHRHSGMQVRFFDGTAEVRRDDSFDVYAGDQMQGLYRGVANGNLLEVLE